jgi:hypothetical protein
MNEHNTRTDTPFASIVHLRWEKNFHFLFVRHYPGMQDVENWKMEAFILMAQKSRMELALEIQRNRSTHFLRDSTTAAGLYLNRWMKA